MSAERDDSVRAAADAVSAGKATKETVDALLGRPHPTADSAIERGPATPEDRFAELARLTSAYMDAPEEAMLRRDNRLEGVPLCYLRGGYAPEKLTGFYRAMMAPMARLVSRAPAETEADRAMRDAFRDGGDWVSPERLAPVLAWLDGD